MSSAATRTLQTGVRSDHASRKVGKSYEPSSAFDSSLQHVGHARVAV